MKMTRLSHIFTIYEIVFISHIFLIHQIDETIKQLILDLSFHQTLKSTSTSTTIASMTSTRH
jgi:hypothetical protein